MTGTSLLWLILICLATSAISVVTGSTSLITVPAMLQFHLDPRTALATNMFALTFMSIGGVLPFVRGAQIDRKRLPTLLVLTLAGSTMGAYLMLRIPDRSVPVIVSSAMIGVALFSALYRKAGIEHVNTSPSARSELAGYALTFLLGIYGGFFSGGYVTILTAVFVAFFRYSFIEAIAITKLMNVSSSAIATAIFMSRGAVDFRLGIILGATMFFGAVLGARFAIRLSNVWLRRIFLTAVWVLGLKALFYDVAAKNLGWGIPSHAEP
jgi:uncharacterized membrane protein YfcA